MKKLFVLLLGLILFSSFVYADSWSYDSSNSYGCASAYAKLTATYPECEGVKYGDYCVGKWFTTLSHQGDKFYLKTQASSWTTADSSGYSGMQEINDGKQYLDVNGEFPKFIICAWDYASCNNGDWAWTGKCGGYLGAGVLDNKRNIKCYNNAECGAGYYCDRNTGNTDWRTWKCMTAECEAEKCSGINSYACENYKFVNKGVIKGKCGVDCLANEEKCESYNSYVCENYKWVNKGSIINKCGVDCLNGEKCVGLNYSKCENNKFVNKGLVLNKCNVECLNEEKCVVNNYYSCENNKFVNKGLIEGKCNYIFSNVYQIINNKCVLNRVLVSNLKETDYSSLEECEKHIKWFSYYYIIPIILIVYIIIYFMFKRK